MILQDIDKMQKAVDELQAYVNNIKNNKEVFLTFTSKLKDLSNEKYYTEYQEKINYYLEKFLNGAKRKKVVDTSRSDARNAKDFVEVYALKPLCREFIQEHFTKVQKPFWEQYKSEWKEPKHNDNCFVSKRPVSPKDIYETIKKIKEENKK